VSAPEDGPHPHWHVPGQCDANPWTHPPRPAEYWWLANNDCWFSVCAECCARWRAVGEEHPDLAAVRITSAR
jgi:hypothetical protein